MKKKKQASIPMRQWEKIYDQLPQHLRPEINLDEYGTDSAHVTPKSI